MLFIKKYAGYYFRNMEYISFTEKQTLLLSCATYILDIKRDVKKPQMHQITKLCFYYKVISGGGNNKNIKGRCRVRWIVVQVWWE
jgi:hypothetical protein